MAVSHPAPLTRVTPAVILPHGATSFSERVINPGPSRSGRFLVRGIEEIQGRDTLHNLNQK
jgi:hypothetical protein